MSFWTYIRGTIEVDVPGRTQPEIQYIISSVLDHLPRVTGSEGDMDITFQPRKGHNCSSSCDEYGMRTNNLKDSYGCKSRRGWLETQSEYMIVVNANLRDRMFDETYKEFMKWLIRLSKRLWVRDVLVRIEGWTHEKFKRTTIDKPGGFDNMLEMTNWNGKHHKYDEDTVWWGQHLMWDRAPDYDVPMTLIEKYGWDDEIIDEAKRRREWGENLERSRN